MKNLSSAYVRASYMYMYLMHVYTCIALLFPQPTLFGTGVWA